MKFRSTILQYFLFLYGNAERNLRELYLENIFKELVNGLNFRLVKTPRYKRNLCIIHINDLNPHSGDIFQKKC